MAFKMVTFPNTRGGAFVRFTCAGTNSAAAANFSGRACELYALDNTKALLIKHDRNAGVFVFQVVSQDSVLAAQGVPLSKRSSKSYGFAALPVLELDPRLANAGRIALEVQKIDGEEWITFTANDPAKKK